MSEYVKDSSINLRAVAHLDTEAQAGFVYWNSAIDLPMGSLEIFSDTQYAPFYMALAKSRVGYNGLPILLDPVTEEFLQTSTALREMIEDGEQSPELILLDALQSGAISLREVTATSLLECATEVLDRFERHLVIWAKYEHFQDVDALSINANIMLDALCDQKDSVLVSNFNALRREKLLHGIERTIKSVPELLPIYVQLRGTSAA